MLALQDNILKYEAVNGKIKNYDGHGGAAMPMNFGGPVAQA